MTSWQELEALANHYNLMKGMLIETNLLGAVGWRNYCGSQVPHIPFELQQSAKSYGFTIEGADIKQNLYILRALKDFGKYKVDSSIN